MTVTYGNVRKLGQRILPPSPFSPLRRPPPPGRISGRRGTPRCGCAVPVGPSSLTGAPGSRIRCGRRSGLRHSRKVGNPPCVSGVATPAADRGWCASRYRLRALCVSTEPWNRGPVRAARGSLCGWPCGGSGGLRRWLPVGGSQQCQDVIASPPACPPPRSRVQFSKYCLI